MRDFPGLFEFLIPLFSAIPIFPFLRMLAVLDPSDAIQNEIRSTCSDGHLRTSRPPNGVPC
jgi:hypothetical protein